MSPRKKLLLIIDVQNDFCAKKGKFDKIGEPINKIKKVMPNLKNAIDLARKEKMLVAFSASYQKFSELPKNIKERIIIQNRRENYLEKGSWGFDFFQVTPLKHEKVFLKNRYDIFTNKEFEKFLIKNKIEEIVFCGFFIDMCVDSAMRTAFQKGYYVTLLKDATNALFFKQKEIENFMKKFYNAEVLTTEEFFENEIKK